MVTRKYSSNIKGYSLVNNSVNDVHWKLAPSTLGLLHADYLGALDMSGFVSLGPFHCARFIFVLCITVCCMHNCLGL